MPICRVLEGGCAGVMKGARPAPRQEHVSVDKACSSLASSSERNWTAQQGLLPVCSVQETSVKDKPCEGQIIEGVSTFPT